MRWSNLQAPSNLAAPHRTGIHSFGLAAASIGSIHGDQNLLYTIGPNSPGAAAKTMAALARYLHHPSRRNHGDGSRRIAPLDLSGRRFPPRSFTKPLAPVPVSPTHFHILFALLAWGVSSSLFDEYSACLVVSQLWIMFCRSFCRSWRPTWCICCRLGFNLWVLFCSCYAMWILVEFWYSYDAKVRFFECVYILHSEDRTPWRFSFWSSMSTFYRWILVLVSFFSLFGRNKGKEAHQMALTNPDLFVLSCCHRHFNFWFLGAMNLISCRTINFVLC